ncbi:MAG: mercury(II) reductase, partial [Deinococcus sp.]|nr:mercury(II) reductase [Deinococcus sp.]
GAHRQLDATVIPRAVFTNPEVGAVGLSEPEAVAAGYRCRCRVLDLAVVPKAAAIRDTRGVVKMIADGRTQRILGVQLVMPRGADIIHEATLAVRGQLTLQDLIDTLHVYPTLSEALRMVAQSFTRDVRQLSCCAE